MNAKTPNTATINRIAQVANIPVQYVRAYYSKEQIPKSCVSSIETARQMLRV